MRKYQATRRDQLIVNVWDEDGVYSYQLFDGNLSLPRDSWVLIESGPIDVGGKPTRAQALQCADVEPSTFVHVLGV